MKCWTVTSGYSLKASASSSDVADHRRVAISSTHRGGTHHRKDRLTLTLKFRSTPLFFANVCAKPSIDRFKILVGTVQCKLASIGLRRAHTASSLAVRPSDRLARKSAKNAPAHSVDSGRCEYPYRGFLPRDSSPRCAGDFSRSGSLAAERTTAIVPIAAIADVFLLRLTVIFSAQF